MLDWQRRGVGRIARASGTRKPKIYQAMVRMLADLYANAELDLLRAVRDGRLHPLDLYERWRRRREMPSVEALRPLVAAVDEWLASFAGRKRSNYRTAFNRLMRHGAPDMTLAALPDLVRADKAVSEQAGQAPSFNRAKATAQSFARDTLGRRHHIYVEISDIMQIKETRKQRSRLTIGQAVRVRDQLPEPLATMWWHLCLTGMIVSEYEGRWRLLPDGVEVRGGKAAGRWRIVPRASTLVRVKVNRKELSAALTALGVESYDARRAYLHWLEEAKIPRARRRIYAGHGPKDTTDLYEMGELSGFRVEDGKVFKAYLRREGSKKSPNAKLQMASGR